MKPKTNANGPGRPSYKVKWPYTKFTFTQLMVLNGVNPDTGKGKNCTRLTLYKHLQTESSGPKSLIVKVKDETRDPNSKHGLGRKAFVFIRREKLNALKTARRSTISVKVDAAKASADYETKKAAIMAPDAPALVTPPTPEPALTVPSETTFVTTEVPALAAAA